MMASNGRRWKGCESEEGIGLGVALDKPAGGRATPTKTVVVNSFHFRRVARRPQATSVGNNADLGCGAKGAAAVSPLGSRVERVGSSPSKPRGRRAYCFPDETSHFKVAGFLRSCHRCRKNLDGKDIYMYRGDKAFCSTECRYQQMRKGEKLESHRTAEGS